MGFSVEYLGRIEKELNKRLWDEECKLALACKPGAAFITLKAVNGKNIVVARRKDWDGVARKYDYKVQIYENTPYSLNTLWSGEFPEENLEKGGMFACAENVARYCR